MKIAITAMEQGLNAAPSPIFGRSPVLVIKDTATGQVESFTNASDGVEHGAGTKTAQRLVSEGVHVVVTGRVGPNAWEVCNAAGIRFFKTAGDTVEQALDHLRFDELEPLEPASKLS